MTRLTQIAHEGAREVLAQGGGESPQWALDGTSGNGHDTLFLAKEVSIYGGTVWSFDCQKQALNHTETRLRDHGLESRVKLVHASHSEIRNHVPGDLRGRFSVFMYNLGYLPGSDRSVVTLPASTLPALDQSLELLRPGGAGFVTVYRGHAGGREESDAIDGWRADLGDYYSQETHFPSSRPEDPYLLVIRKKAE